MNIDCGIVRDLLPLYAEDICGEETKLAVEEHLKRCADCRARLEDMKASDSTAPVSALPLKAVSKKIRKNRHRAVVLALCTLLFFVTAYYGRIKQPDPIPYSEDFFFSFTKDESGIWMQYDEILSILSIEGRGMIDGDYAFTMFFEKARTVPTLYDDLPDPPWQAKRNYGNIATGTILFPSPEDTQVLIYYANPEGPATLLYGNSPSDSFGFAVLPRLAQNYYVIAMGVLFLFLALLSLIFWLLKKPKAGRILMYISSFPLSYVISHFAVKGTSQISWDILLDLRYILIAAAFASATMILTAIQIRAWRQAQNQANQAR